MAVGRDLNLGPIYRPNILEFSDKSIGKEILKFSKSDLEITLITTPGHTGSSCSLIIKGENVTFKSDLEQKVTSVALVGDVWDFHGDEEVWKEMAEDIDTNIKSRNFIINHEGGNI